MQGFGCIQPLNILLYLLWTVLYESSATAPDLDGDVAVKATIGVFHVTVFVIVALALSISNGAVLVVLSHCGCFQVAGLVAVALAWTHPTTGIPLYLAVLPQSFTACWSICCCLVLCCSNCFKLLVAIVICLDRCRSLLEASQEAGALGMVSVPDHHACAFLIASFTVLSDNKLVTFTIWA